MIVDPQEFLSQRVNEIKDLITGGASIKNTVSYLTPGGIPGKVALRTGLDMLGSVGKPGASKMSLLGGDAPINDLNYDKIINAPVNEILPGIVGVVQNIR